MRRVPPFVVLVLLGLLLASHALAQRRHPPARTAAFVVQLRLIDETGAPVLRATVKLPDRVFTATDGLASIETNGPVAVVVSANGFLPEPVVVSRNLEPELTVKLWRKIGADGRPRVVFHFGGDTMLGRRFEQPTRTDTPVLSQADGGSAARAVVSELGPIFGAADISTVNLETVIGTLSRPGAYSAKRFLLMTPPSALSALNELGVDAVTLGNNHSNDWEGAGVASTRSSLTKAGLAFAGAGESDAEARAPVILHRRGQTVGLLSYTTVTGDFVNDNLPTSDDARPLSVPAGEQWQYELRRFGVHHAAGHAALPDGGYRAGDAWRWFNGLEHLDPETEAAVWRDLRTTYPELQDWVARRGHGGAAAFSRKSVDADVKALRQAGVDFVVVEIHGGFQFSEATSKFFRKAAHESIDAGADVVVGHHPHVVQGFEWYRGKLVIHSLGNLVFDQDFLSTFPSMFVRGIYEGDRLLEARVYPLILDRYRPVPVSGELAAKILRGLRSASDLGAPSDRTQDGSIARVPAEGGPGPNARPADIRIDGNSGVITQPLRSYRYTAKVDEDGAADVPPPLIVRPDSLPVGTKVGLDLLRVGDADDVTANQAGDGGVGWDFAAARRTSLVAVDRDTGDLGFKLTSLENRSSVIRPIARVMRKTHRFRTLTGTAADGHADYSVRLRVRNTGHTNAYLRFDLYRFDDSDPLRDPVSMYLRRITIPLMLPKDDDWHTISVPVPSNVFRPVAGRAVNTAMVYIGLRKGRWREAEFDRIQVLEWRNAETFPRRLWLEADALVPTPGARSVDALVR